MKPIKPRYEDTVKVDWRIPKRSKQLISLYSKYTKYDEEYLIERAISEVLEDKAFAEWLDKRRYQKRVQNVVSDVKGRALPEPGDSKEAEDLDF